MNKEQIMKPKAIHPNDLIEVKEELWLPIPNYPNYEISNHGYIRNNITGKIRKGNADSGGYLRMTLARDDGVSETIKVHRLVAKTWLPKPGEERNQVNHVDSDRVNNRVDNLEWVTNAENYRHAMNNNRYKMLLDVIVYNQETKETIKFKGLDPASAYIGVVPNALAPYILNSKNNPFLGKYIITVPPYTSDNGAPSDAVVYYVYDLLDNGKLCTYNGLTQTIIYTGLRNIPNINKRNNNGVINTAGYVVSVTALVDLDKYHISTRTDRVKYLNKTYLPNIQLWGVYDYSDNREYKFDNIKNVMNLINNLLGKIVLVTPSSVSNAISSGRRSARTGLLMGYGVTGLAKVSDAIEWYKYSDRQIINNKEHRPTSSPIYTLTINGLSTLIMGNLHTVKIAVLDHLDKSINNIKNTDLTLHKLNSRLPANIRISKLD